MLKIYFVEDDAAIRESIIRNVKWEKHGYDFIGQAADGEIAYSEIQTLRPDVIITDLRMPFMDGLELSKLVRKEMPETKIIILTGYDDFESVQEALNIGVAKYLLKPVTPDTLVDAIVNMRDLIYEEQELRAQRRKYLESIAEQRDLTLQDVDNIKIDRAAVGRFLRSGSLNTVDEMVESLIDDIGRDKLESFLLRQYVIMDAKFMVAEFLDDIGIDGSLISKHFEEIRIQPSNLKTISDTTRYLAELIKCALKLRNENVNKRYDSSVEKAQEYIREHYAREDISLNMVSKHVNLSPTHFSTVFSQESGKTFKEFLAEVRIDKAKELLLCSPKRSSEIAYEVGYRDSHYFSYVFKKATGYSPREFRLNAKEA